MLPLLSLSLTPQVISSAFVQISIVCLVGWALYFATGDFHIILGALRRTHTHIHSNPARRSLRRYLSTPSVFLSSFTATQEAYSAPLPIFLIDTRRVLLVQLLQDFTLSLSDLQTFAGISYYVAVFSQLSSIDRMDMYHMALIQQISWFAPVAHGQALQYAFVPGLDGLTVRIVAISLFCAQFLAFEGVYLVQLVQTKRRREWCYLQADDSIMWVIMDILIVVWIYVPFLGVIRNHRRYRREMRGSKKDDDDEEVGTDSLVFVERPPRLRPWVELSVLQRVMAVVNFVGRVFAAKIFNLMAVTVWIVLQVVEYGTTKRGNLNGPEQDQWGFGQVLAMAALASIAFEAYKLYQREFVVSV